ncbi:MAG: glycerophosphodiester phosphodiesterase [Robiginitomaculum sp.]|nr:MAG: glycerophosphodiester phosphodiesterase [Robiginitomaculum sp.]
MSDNNTAQPLVIAHRGAPGYLPEHTAPGYDLAIRMGADYIEPDLVFTKDGHLIVRHDHYLSTTTNVADHAEFADRKTVKDGHEGEDWFSEDFTLAEIKTLRAKQAFASRNHAADGKFEILTFAEVIELAQRRISLQGRQIGIYPETKLPSYFASLGYDFESAVLSELSRVGWDAPGSSVFIQSFEDGILRSLRNKTELPLIMLLEKADGVDMKDIATYANGVGPSKALLANKDGSSTGFIEAAHASGLKVHPWTFRSDMLPEVFANAQAEFDFFFDLGVDGIFTDFANDARAALLARAARSG